MTSVELPMEGTACQDMCRAIFEGHEVSAVHAWLRANADGKWRVNPAVIEFDDETDATMFRMRFA